MHRRRCPPRSALHECAPLLCPLPYARAHTHLCRLVVFANVNDATRCWIKGRQFSLVGLLADSSEGGVDRAAGFEGGGMAVFRLAPQDYHRWVCGLEFRVSETLGAPELPQALGGLPALAACRLACRPWLLAACLPARATCMHRVPTCMMRGAQAGR